MTPTRQRRLLGVLIVIVGVSAAVAIATYSLQENLLFFVSPSEAQTQTIASGRQFRLGGLVAPGSVERQQDSLAVRFTVTDGAESMEVEYDGILPDLFKEGQGVIAIGALNDSGLFVAHQVLAKHDEKYMPPEVAEALEKAGHPMDSTK